MPEKYVVFKKEDWDEVRGSVGTGGLYAMTELRQRAVPDAVVIRHQDIYAAAAFNEYAGQIRTSLEVFEHLNDERLLTEEEMLRINRLHQLADYFHDQARQADDHRIARKLPD